MTAVITMVRLQKLKKETQQPPRDANPQIMIQGEWNMKMYSQPAPHNLLYAFLSIPWQMN